MLCRLGLAALLLVSSVACKRESTTLTSKPRAVELTEDGEGDTTGAAVVEAAPTAPVVPVTGTTTRAPGAPAPSGPREPGPFPLPVIAGATVQRRYTPVMASTREMQQIVIESARPLAELVKFYERALIDAGYTVTTSAPQPDEQVLLQGKGRVGRNEAMVVVMRAPARQANVVSMTVTRLVKP